MKTSPIEKAIQQHKADKNAFHTEDELKALTAFKSNPTQSFLQLKTCALPALYKVFFSEQFIRLSFSSPHSLYFAHPEKPHHSMLNKALSDVAFSL